ncbi:hypothetical protein [Stenotrophomonas phage A1432]|uniref:Uncharacterized protein n=1 Tax=Stenotrophomonas phage A1432 TaxID=2930315 RepID=A0A9E7N415_9CAUD|nr:hypothetical protein P9A45_gp53 [Stenotrophomonas phage A1432]UTC27977.1 hypothetical protein [Stenotrophomonas phage A1432]
MAYATGTASSPLDLLDKLKLFLEANGWTTNMYQQDGPTSPAWRLHVQKGADLFANLYASNNSTFPAINQRSGSSNVYAMGVNMSDGFNAANGWHQQPGSPLFASYRWAGIMSELAGAMPAYHFFSYPDSDDILIAVEFRTGVYQFMGFGRLAKFTPTAEYGQWFFGSTNSADSSYGTSYDVDGTYQKELIPFRLAYLASGNYAVSSFVRVNIDSINGWAASARRNTDSPAPLAAAGQARWDEWMRSATMTAAGWQTVLLRQTVYIPRSDTSYSPFGEIKYMRRLEMTNYLAAEEFTLGSEVWKVFPYRQKGGPSLQRGIAIRKVV